MRAVQFDEYGDVGVLEVRDVADPEPDEGRVVVRVRAAGINPGEIAIREGAMAESAPSDFPSGQGSDLAGEVQAVGAGVTAFEPGDPVLGWSDERSSQAELVSVPAEHLVVKPRSLGWEVAGSLYVGPATGHARGG